MSTLGEKLRAARLQRGLSLEDLAQATKINIRFFDEIERGNVPNLPVTYYRAFIRSFARQVGLDGDELLRAELPPPPTPVSAAGVPAPPVPVPADSPAAPVPQPASSGPELPRRTATFGQEAQGAARTGSPPKTYPVKTLIVLMVILAVGLALSVVWMKNERSPRPVEEISVSSPAKQDEPVAPRPARDSIAAGAPETAATADSVDSLTLKAATLDSVWLRIDIDGIAIHEYTFPPHYTMQWKARQFFVVSVGNGAGMEFTLNGLAVGVLGDQKKPVLGVNLSRATLPALLREKGDAGE